MADDLEEYDMEQDKFMPGKGGKGRSKQEASSHTNHHDPSGQTRKIVTKMQNTEKNRLEAGGDKGPAQKKVAAPAEEDWRVGGESWELLEENESGGAPLSKSFSRRRGVYFDSAFQTLLLKNVR